MAKLQTGPLAGQVSGSIGGQTFSHNKGGLYVRNRAIPTNPSSLAQQTVRGFLATASQRWKTLTTVQRQAWEEWARQNPVIDTLGNSILISGQSAQIRLNAVIQRDGGTMLDVPPVTGRPTGFSSVVQDGDIGAGDVDLTFAPALPSGFKVELWACVVNSAGISYVQNLYKFIAFSAADQASPWANDTAIEAVLGTLVVGQTLHVKAAVYDPATGQRSTFLRSQVVISTT